MALKGRLAELTKRRSRSARSDIPFTGAFMSEYASQTVDGAPARDGAGTVPQPTVAAFSPNQQTASKTRDTKSVLIHQKSPLLVATPPSVTRTLAYSHPFILPLDRLAGLLSWTSGDPWESFLLLAVFWFAVLYVDTVVRWAGPLVVVVTLSFGMYSRRYSPLSSTVWSDITGKRKRVTSEQRKSLDEILHTLQQFTDRCDVLLDPFLRLTEYLSTQSTPTAATTRPALTTLFIRILTLTPVWIALSLPPVRVITLQRVILLLGTVGLSWHCRYAHATRAILWRSRSVRRTLSFFTGLQFSDHSTAIKAPPLPPRAKAAAANALSTQDVSPGVRFTFVIFENQRRWLGLGWTASLFAYERQAWTNEFFDDCPDPNHYTLPESDNASAKWQWVSDSQWRIEGAAKDKENSAKRIGGGGGGDENGWAYCDNKWEDPRKTDGWSRYTRWRKWVRDAELVEVKAKADFKQESNLAAPGVSAKDIVESSGSESPAKKKPWLARRTTGSHEIRLSTSGVDRADATSATGSVDSRRSRDSVEDDVHTPLERLTQHDWDRSMHDDLAPGLS